MYSLMYIDSQFISLGGNIQLIFSATGSKTFTITLLEQIAVEANDVIGL